MTCPLHSTAEVVKGLEHLDVFRSVWHIFRCEHVWLLCGFPHQGLLKLQSVILPLLCRLAPWSATYHVDNYCSVFFCISFFYFILKIMPLSRTFFSFHGTHVPWTGASHLGTSVPSLNADDLLIRSVNPCWWYACYDQPSSTLSWEVYVSTCTKKNLSCQISHLESHPLPHQTDPCYVCVIS